MSSEMINKKGALDYTHAKKSLAWRGALFWVEFHPRSDPGGTVRASGVVVKVVDISKSGGKDKGVFLGVVIPPYKNVTGHLKQNACILVDVAIDPIKIHKTAKNATFIKKLHFVCQKLFLQAVSVSVAFEVGKQ